MSNDTVHVDPHITQYTVYITDNYTGESIVEKNVTETHFTYNTSDDGSCLMYQVSAWNAGGEGELSEPVQESRPQGKQFKKLPGLIYQLVGIPSLIPRLIFSSCTWKKRGAQG